MKNRIVALIMVLITVFAFSSCKKAPKNIELKETSVSMKVGDKHTVELGKEMENITWTSRDESIATVSQNGEITAVAAGITVVTVMSEDNYAHVGVNVKGSGGYVDKDGNVVEIFDGESDITEIEVGVKSSSSKGDVTIKVGEKQTLRAYVTPSDSKDKITWRVADPSIVSVDENGEMVGVSKGKTNITAYAPNGVKGVMIVRVK